MYDTDALGEQIVAESRRDVDSLDVDGRWSAEDDDDLERRFARATYDALRAPRIAERSVRLRKLARRTIPRPLRPKLRRALARIERVYEVFRDRREQK